MMEQQECLFVDNKLFAESKRVERKRLFGGMIRDFRNRFCHYKSDFQDALTLKTLPTIVFVFLASITPAVTFGGLMGQYTEEAMGMSETLIAQCICGIIFALFAAQPMMIVSATGPVLIFEHSLYMLCQAKDLDFLSIRVYAGFWIFVISIFVVAFDGARMLVYTFAENPVLNYDSFLEIYGNCRNKTFVMLNPTYECRIGQPNTALLSFIAFISTFAIACTFKAVRESYWFGRHCRNFFGDYGVAVAIFLVSGVVHGRLNMPETLSFTNSESRGHRWLVIPHFSTMESRREASQLSLAAALLVFMLMFAETEVTELLLLRKETKLTKGGGMHWDLLLMGFCALLCSLTGLPWMCAAAVQSLAHCGALTINERKTPGGKLAPSRVIEQRVTALAVAILTGMFARLGQHLQLPIASLFGVFMYLGVMNLINVQLVERVTLFLRPVKYYPDTNYVRKVSVCRIHLFTVIQVLLLCGIYAVKQSKQTALAFPFVLLLFVIFRHLAIGRIFTKGELEALDGEEDHEDEGEGGNDCYGSAPIPV
ncbi:hypothetical protein Q1695_001048 [Nippostrongylus brasiliensis]|nr:hypothetical protein Q1695_001048 [Nippostrongylus brasiliensis]